MGTGGGPPGICWTGAGIVRRRKFQWRWRRDWDRGGNLYDHGVRDRYGRLDQPDARSEVELGRAVTRGHRVGCRGTCPDISRLPANSWLVGLPDNWFWRKIHPSVNPLIRILPSFPVPRGSLGRAKPRKYGSGVSLSKIRSQHVWSGVLVCPCELLCCTPH